MTALIERVVAQSSRSSSRAGVILMGHGFGGTLGLQIAATRPELVRHLVMVGSTGWYLDPTLYGPDEAVVVGMIWRRRLGTGTTDLARALTNELRLTYSEDDRPPLAALQAEAERWLAWGFNPHDEHRSAWLGAPSLWAAAKSLGCPTTVIHGARDPVLPVMHSERLAALIPGARLNIVPGAGHALSAPMRDQLLRVLRDLIEPDTTD